MKKLLYTIGFFILVNQLFAFNGTVSFPSRFGTPCTFSIIDSTNYYESEIYDISSYYLSIHKIQINSNSITLYSTYKRADDSYTYYVDKTVIYTTNGSFLWTINFIGSNGDLVTSNINVDINLDWNSVPEYQGSNPLVINAYLGSSFSQSLALFSNNPTSYILNVGSQPESGDIQLINNSLEGTIYNSSQSSLTGSFYATNDAGNSDTIPYVININSFGSQDDDLNFTSPTTGQGRAGQYLSYKISSNYDSESTYGCYNLPSFLTFDGTNTISGTVPDTGVGSFSFTVTAYHIEKGSIEQNVQCSVLATTSEVASNTTSAVSNFDDISNTTYAKNMNDHLTSSNTHLTDVKTKLDASNVQLTNANTHLSDLKTKADTTNTHLSDLNSKNEISNTHLNDIKSHLDTMNTTLSTGINVTSDNSDIVSSIADLQNYNSLALGAQKSVLDNIKQALTSAPETTDFDLDYTKEVQTSSVASDFSSAQFFTNHLTHEFDTVQPAFKIPFSEMSEYLPLETDITIDFEANDFLKELIKWIRRVEAGGVVFLALYAIWQLLRSFEF